MEFNGKPIYSVKYNEIKDPPPGTLSLNDLVQPSFFAL